MPSFRVVTVKDDLTGRYVAQLYRPADAPEPVSVTRQSFASPQTAVSALLASLEPHFLDPLLVPDP
jgi:hypothetical protein